MEAPAQESAVNVHNDGLNLLRVDDRYDDDVPTNGIDDQDPWRVIEVNTHKSDILQTHRNTNVSFDWCQLWVLHLVIFFASTGGYPVQSEDCLW